jgi:hypothetical protein
MISQTTVDQPEVSQPNETQVAAQPRQARGLRGKFAKMMWKVSFELDPIIGSFFRSHEVPPTEAEHRSMVEADRQISGQRAGW